MIFILFFPILLLLAVFAILVAIVIQKENQKERQLAQELKERRARHLEELDTSIADWLLTLELPALEEETRRLETARQLRTVLIEKLLRQRITSN